MVFIELQCPWSHSVLPLLPSRRSSAYRWPESLACDLRRQVSLFPIVYLSCSNMVENASQKYPSSIICLKAEVMEQSIKIVETWNSSPWKHCQLWFSAPVTLPCLLPHLTHWHSSFSCVLRCSESRPEHHLVWFCYCVRSFIPPSRFRTRMLLWGHLKQLPCVV